MLMVTVGADLPVDSDSEGSSSASEVVVLRQAMELLAICDGGPWSDDDDFNYSAYGDHELDLGDDHWDPEEIALPKRTDVATGVAE